MNTTVEEAVGIEKVIELALALSSHDQALLLARLHDHLTSIGEDPEHEAAWAAEIDRRVREIESGEAELIDHDIVMRDARELLAPR